MQAGQRRVKIARPSGQRSSFHFGMRYETRFNAGAGTGKWKTAKKGGYNRLVRVHFVYVVVVIFCTLSRNSYRNEWRIEHNVQLSWRRRWKGDNWPSLQLHVAFWIQIHKNGHRFTLNSIQQSSGMQHTAGTPDLILDVGQSDWQLEDWLSNCELMSWRAILESCILLRLHVTLERVSSKGLSSSNECLIANWWTESPVTATSQDKMRI